MSDGVRLAADLYLPDGAGPFAALLEALPYRKDDLTASYRPEYRRLVAEGRFAVVQGRPPRHRLVRRGRHGRVPPVGAARPGGGHRLAGGAAVVQRPRRHVRHQLLGLQLHPDGLRAATRSRRHLRHLRHGRPVHRRRALHGRSAAGRRPRRLLPLHDADERPATGARGVRGGLARRMAPAGGADGTVDADVAPAPARRRVLAPRLAAPRVRADHLRDDAGRRVGRRLSQQLAAHLRRTAMPQVAADGALEPHEHRARAARPPHRPRARDDSLVRPLVAGRGHGRRRRTADPPLRPPRHPAGARSGASRRCVALRDVMAARTLAPARR